MIVIYGLKNCDTCRKALKVLATGTQPYRFHDLRTDGLPAERLAVWLRQLGWETLLNRRSATWRGLPKSDRADLDPLKAERLLASHPTLIKRPVIEADGELLVGLAGKEQAALKALLG